MEQIFFLHLQKVIPLQQNNFISSYYIKYFSFSCLKSPFVDNDNVIYFNYIIEKVAKIVPTLKSYHLNTSYTAERYFSNRNAESFTNFTHVTLMLNLQRKTDLTRKILFLHFLLFLFVISKEMLRT